MTSPEELTSGHVRAKVEELRGRLFDDALTPFINANPNVPAQAVMLGLGELLVQFSLGQVGIGETQRLLDELKRAVDKFGQKVAPQH